MIKNRNIAPDAAIAPEKIIGGLAGLVIGRVNKYLYVDATNGSNTFSGRSLDKAKATIGAAVTAAVAGDVIIVLPGSYDETVTIARGKSNIKIVGVGGRGAAYIEPSTEDADGMIVHADDVTLINIGVAAEDTTAGNYALTVTGSRFRAHGCKFEGGEIQALVGPGTAAQETAGTHGRGGDIIFEDCEFAWGTDGVTFQGTDYGAATQIVVKDCRFHNLTGDHINDKSGSGATASILFRNVQLIRNVHDDAEGGTAPTMYVDLDTDNGNDGVLVGSYFPQAANGAKVLLSTALHCIGVFFTGGISTGQPT